MCGFSAYIEVRQVDNVVSGGGMRSLACRQKPNGTSNVRILHTNNKHWPWL